MAINLATKYSNEVIEKFKLGALTEGANVTKVDFVGAKTVKVYSIPTATMNDYSRTGSARYGTPSDLADTVQELTLGKDRSFTFVVDAGDNADQMGIKNAALALARQIDEVIIPEIDAYRIATLVAGAGTTKTAALETDAYIDFLNAVEVLDENKVPASGRIAFVTPAFYNSLKLSTSFVKASEMAQSMLIKGVVGEVDGVAIVKVPSSYFPTKTPFVMCHNTTLVSPIKLSDYTIHENPPGVNGVLVEGRVYYDAFVLDTLEKGVYARKTV
jgi:N4-gp56 family major capsid protein